MKRRKSTLDPLRSSIAAYVRRQFRALPEADAEDLISAAYCEAQGRLHKYDVGQRGKALRATIAKQCVIHTWRDANIGQNAFCRAFLPLETPTEEDEREKADYSDHGAGVERMTRQIDAEDERLPDWVYGVRIERAKLYGTERRIVNALANGKSIHSTQYELRLDWPTFRGKMKKLSERFAPYYKGLCEWRASHPFSAF